MSILETINIEEVKKKLYENLKPSGWGDKLKSFILSSDFDKIINTLLAEAKQGKRFTPVLKQVFRAFEECPLNELKVVIIGQDPYPQGPVTVREGKDGMVREVSRYPVADGIPFSCSNTNNPQPSLKYIFKAINETVYTDGYDWDPDLKRWSNQGILMINCAFTTQITKTGVHYALWKPFLEFLFDYLSINHPDVIYIYLGRKAEEWSTYVPEDSSKLFASHPASAAYQDLEKWDCNDIFNKTSELVKKQFNEEIIW